jgi:hypothetical protein
MPYLRAFICCTALSALREFLKCGRRTTRVVKLLGRQNIHACGHVAQNQVLEDSGITRLWKIRALHVSRRIRALQEPWRIRLIITGGLLFWRIRKNHIHVVVPWKSGWLSREVALPAFAYAASIKSSPCKMANTQSAFLPSTRSGIVRVKMQLKN